MQNQKVSNMTGLIIFNAQQPGNAKPWLSGALCWFRRALLRMALPGGDPRLPLGDLPSGTGEH